MIVYVVKMVKNLIEFGISGPFDSKEDAIKFIKSKEIIEQKNYWIEKYCDNDSLIDRKKY